MNPLIEELKERGLYSQTFGNLEECLSKPTAFYLGLDPTSDSLGIHHMVGLMVSRLMQKYGHKPIILVGGATCAIGDPSGKSEEERLSQWKQFSITLSVLRIRFPKSSISSQMPPMPPLW